MDEMDFFLENEKFCDWCFFSPNNLMKCAKCQIYHYCNINCQSSHWKYSHKSICGTIKERKKSIKIKDILEFELLLKDNEFNPKQTNDSEKKRVLLIKLINTNKQRLNYKLVNLKSNYLINNLINEWNIVAKPLYNDDIKYFKYNYLRIQMEYLLEEIKKGDKNNPIFDKYRNLVLTNRMYFNKDNYELPNLSLDNFMKKVYLTEKYQEYIKRDDIESTNTVYINCHGSKPEDYFIVPKDVKIITYQPINENSPTNKFGMYVENNCKQNPLMYWPPKGLIACNESMECEVIGGKKYTKPIEPHIFESKEGKRLVFPNYKLSFTFNFDDTINENTRIDSFGIYLCNDVGDTTLKVKDLIESNTVKKLKEDYKDIIHEKNDSIMVTDYSAHTEKSKFGNSFRIVVIKQNSKDIIYTIAWRDFQNNVGDNSLKLKETQFLNLTKCEVFRKINEDKYTKETNNFKDKLLLKTPQPQFSNRCINHSKCGSKGLPQFSVTHYTLNNTNIKTKLCKCGAFICHDDCRNSHVCVDDTYYNKFKSIVTKDMKVKDFLYEKCCNKLIDLKDIIFFFTKYTSFRNFSLRICKPVTEKTREHLSEYHSLLVPTPTSAPTPTPTSAPASVQELLSLRANSYEAAEGGELRTIKMFYELPIDKSSSNFKQINMDEMSNRVAAGVFINPIPTITEAQFVAIASQVTNITPIVLGKSRKKPKRKTKSRKKRGKSKAKSRKKAQKPKSKKKK